MDSVERDIYNDDYSLFQRILYGGVSSGSLVIPTNFFKLIFTLIFPPIGEILNAVSKFLIDKFPFITWEAVKAIFEYDNLTRIVYSFVLTSMFYFPGLIYVLSKIETATPNINGTLKCSTETGKCEMVQ
jgi:hypothetical protein